MVKRRQRQREEEPQQKRTREWLENERPDVLERKEITRAILDDLRPKYLEALPEHRRIKYQPLHKGDNLK